MAFKDVLAEKLFPAIFFEDIDCLIIHFKNDPMDIAYNNSGRE